MKKKLQCHSFEERDLSDSDEAFYSTLKKIKQEMSWDG